MQAEKQAMVGKLEQYGQLPGPTYPELVLRSLVAPITSLWQTVTRPKEAYQEKGLTGMVADIVSLSEIGDSSTSCASR
jgi:hypothetical protein